MPNRTAAHLGAGLDPLPALVCKFRRLEVAGCGAVAIPCNIAHGCINRVRAVTSLPILQIVEVTAEALRRQGVGLGLIDVMGTVATLAMGLYQDGLCAEGWAISVLTAEEMACWFSPSIASLKANRVAKSYEPLAKATRALAARGALVVVLNCIEILLGIAVDFALPFPMIDTIEALALAAIRWAWP